MTLRTAARVLLVEDDTAIREAVAAALRDTGLDVRSAADGEELEGLLASYRPSVLVLDWMLPGRDGPTLARVARRTADVGIIMLTAREGVGDRLRGFSAGVDDYVPKPFAMEELVARVRALLGRLGATPTTVEVDDLVVDESAAVAVRGGEPLPLTATEFRLLAYLAQQRGRVVSTTQILTQVWGYEEYSDNLVPANISTLRRKMEAGGAPRLLHTVRGLGYVLRAPAREDVA
ncbi:response regulator transcription factor [Lapillicoccus jejuensis]|uniref:DNA-binding response OmpR family regulator n=1 Tax=Lapillicoccus jejuensis TaxID=402171 RepID=A0A542E3R8_9MICO|nr:response regulator transcription factor [Lapillicoccus jejuensis]TQJ09992.1 DNA-binding response OmpR family regulator [Lapillicoccus jejuensis]